MSVVSPVSTMSAPRSPRVAPPRPVVPVAKAPPAQPEEVLQEVAVVADTPAVVEVPYPGFAFLSSENLALSREQAVEAAKEHLSLTHSPCERPLDRRRLKQLADRIKAGTWLPCCWATVLYEGVLHRMNGQHSSHAMVETAEYLPETVGIHLDRYKADDREGMALLFRQFDMQRSGRTPSDVAGAYQGLVPELGSLSRAKCKQGIEGVAWYLRAVCKEPTTEGDSFFDMLFLPIYYPFLRWFDKIMTSKTGEMEFDGVVGAMYATFVKGGESRSLEFWSHVAKQDLHDANDPRQFLGTLLLKIRDSKNTDHQIRTTQSEYYCRCIKAWNAFCFGQSIKNLDVANPSKKGWPEVAD